MFCECEGDLKAIPPPTDTPHTVRSEVGTPPRPRSRPPSLPPFLAQRCAPHPWNGDEREGGGGGFPAQIIRILVKTLF
jgi:hypothetical protein